MCQFNRSSVLKIAKIIRTLKNMKNEQGEINEGAYALAIALQFLMPIVKVPTNFLGEVISYSAGLPLAARRYHSVGGAKGFKLLEEHIREHPNQAFNPPKSFKGPRVEDGDYIFRNAKKGGLGLVFFLLGMSSAASIGGYYISGEKRKLKDVKPGDIRIFGMDIPHLFLHHPIIFGPLMLGATMKRVMQQYEEYNRKHPDKNKGSGVAEGIHAGVWGAAKGLPFIGTPLQMVESARNYEGLSKFARQIAESQVIPPDIRRISKSQDTAGDVQIPREQKTLGQTLQGSVPFQRQKLPLDVGKFKTMGIDRMDHHAARATGLPGLGRGPAAGRSAARLVRRDQRLLAGGA